MVAVLGRWLQWMGYSMVSDIGMKCGSGSWKPCNDEDIWRLLNRSCKTCGLLWWKNCDGNLRSSFFHESTAAYRDTLPAMESINRYRQTFFKWCSWFWIGYVEVPKIGVPQNQVIRPFWYRNKRWWLGKPPGLKNPRFCFNSPICKPSQYLTYRFACCMSSQVGSALVQHCSQSQSPPAMGNEQREVSLTWRMSSAQDAKYAYPLVIKHGANENPQLYLHIKYINIYKV